MERSGIVKHLDGLETFIMMTKMDNEAIALPASQLERSAQKISREVALLGYHHGVNREKEFFERLGRDVAFRCFPTEMMQELLSSNSEHRHADHG